jgi:hypothetical protein
MTISDFHVFFTTLVSTAKRFRNKAQGCETAASYPGKDKMKSISTPTELCPFVRRCRNLFEVEICFLTSIPRVAAQPWAEGQNGVAVKSAISATSGRGFIKVPTGHRNLLIFSKITH